jgi:hypothetical protein
MTSIKQLKPRKDALTKQGFFNVTNSAKYIDRHVPCIYRSSWEYRFMLWCENTQYVTSWSSEPFPIKYECLETGKFRNYNIDFIVNIEKPEKWLIEVKPLKEVNDAKQFGKLYRQQVDPVKRKKLINSNKTAAKNWAKWQSAKIFAEKSGCRFIIVTEKWLQTI